MKPTFTILLPVHRPPALLPFAIESILAQEREDFELLVVCDGAPKETVDYARSVAKRDARVRVSAHAKGERHGEAYRHQALEEAEGTLVCGSADDDLWFPNHLSEMATLLEGFEFGNLLQVDIKADGSIYANLGDLAIRATQARITKEHFNFFGPTVAGYRLSTYRRLLIGWAPAPLDVFTDMHMWRKFLALPDIACGTRFAVTSLAFPTPQRRDWSLEKRRGEMKHWAERIKARHARDELAQAVLRRLMKEVLDLRHEYTRLRAPRAAT